MNESGMRLRVLQRHRPWLMKKSKCERQLRSVQKSWKRLDRQLKLNELNSNMKKGDELGKRRGRQWKRQQQLRRSRWLTKKIGLLTFRLLQMPQSVKNNQSKTNASV